MRLIRASRASAILFNLLAGRLDKRPILLPANICPIVPITFRKAGHDFEWVDIAADTLGLDLRAASDLLRSGHYGGVLYAHTYGEMSTPWEFFCSVKQQDPSLLLIDDRCLCEPDLNPATDLVADVTLYSTGYAKIVDLGGGGYAFLQDHVSYVQRNLSFQPEALEELERAYKESLGTGKPFMYIDSNWLDTGPAPFGWPEYRKSIKTGLRAARAHRCQINDIYSARFPAEWQLSSPYQNWRFHLRVPERDKVLREVFAQGLFASAHYVSLAGLFSPGHCPHAEALAANVLNLFNDHHFTKLMAERVCDIILKVIL